MGRKAGRLARLYIATAENGSASPVQSTRSWSVNQTRDKLDASCQGDATKVTLQGLADASGDLGGLYSDTETAASLLAALDGASRKMYGYLDATTGADAGYFYCTATFDASLSTDVNGLVEVTGTWAADTPLYWVNVS